ncbi:MAG: 4-hydroxy-tetrahydrodipicolinate synthase [Candidatus Erwinia impunctatus]|nr:4-hydroxy-tetrahydrodipicolinate synthase [Culicoides impunctatus]
MFRRLCAFPLTPISEQGVDEGAYLKLIARLVTAKADAIGVLGSTGSYAYLTLKQRARLVRLAVDAAENTPVITSIGALSTHDVLCALEDAQQAGVSGVLLAPVSYQKLTEDEVFTLYRTVATGLSVPLCIYENPATTQFHFSDELFLRLTELPGVQSIKLSGGLPQPALSAVRVQTLREMLPESVSLGISGDAYAVEGLISGCQVWYSVIGGLFPQLALKMIHLVEQGMPEEAKQFSSQLEPLWAMFREHGSLRVVATAAEILGLAEQNCLPLPLKSLQGAQRSALSDMLSHLSLG